MTFYFIHSMLMCMQKLQNRVGYRDSCSASCCLSLIIAGIQKFILLLSTPQGCNTRLSLLRKNRPPVSPADHKRREIRTEKLYLEAVWKEF